MAPDLYLKVNKDYAKRIRAARKERKIGQVELAMKLGCSQSQMSKIERGNGAFVNYVKLMNTLPRVTRPL